MTPDALHYRRQLARAWLEWACVGGAANTAHPNYRAVIEHRRYVPPSSSCGDLAHWLLYRLGVRLPWINREECRGWRPGLNVNRLSPWPVGPKSQTSAELWTPTAPKLECGDVLIISNTWDDPDPRRAGRDAHVVCVIDELPDGTLCTSEYGQPGGALHAKAWDRVRWGKRQVRVVLRLERVLADAEVAGQLVEPDAFLDDEPVTQVACPRPQR